MRKAKTAICKPKTTRMTPNRTRIFRCNACQGLFAHRHYAKVAGQRYVKRSDDPEWPGLNDYAPPLVACPHCGDAFCLLGAEHESEFFSLDNTSPTVRDSIQKVPDFAKATLAQCETQAQNWDDTDLEWEFRLQAWQRLNDERIETSPRGLDSNQQYNLQRLFGISTRMPNDPLIQVELLRQMSRFEEAVNILRLLCGPVFNPPPQSTVAQLMKAITKKNDQPFYYG
jgi:hypothetical protein